MRYNISKLEAYFIYININITIIHMHSEVMLYATRTLKRRYQRVTLIKFPYQEYYFFK